MKTPVRLDKWHSNNIEDADGFAVCHAAGPSEAVQIIAALNGGPKPLELRVILKSVYGKLTLYPANDAAEALAGIAKTATLDPRVLRIAKDKLGAVVLTVNEDAQRVREMLAAA